MIYCPNCATTRIHLSGRKGILERVILATLFIRPFRCDLCDQRFFRWSFTPKPNSPRTAATQ